MRHRTYLNVILTVNAVLLAAMVWFQIADRPLLADGAWAQPATMPNAAEQRLHMIRSLDLIQKSLAETRDLLKNGKARIEVTNLDTLKEDKAEEGTDQSDVPSHMEVRRQDQSQNQD